MIVYVLLFDTKYYSDQIEVFDNEKKLNQFIENMKDVIIDYEIFEKQISLTLNNVIQ